MPVERLLLDHDPNRKERDDGVVEDRLGYGSAGNLTVISISGSVLPKATPIRKNIIWMER
jgi:hypothetical protein